MKMINYSQSNQFIYMTIFHESAKFSLVGSFYITVPNFSQTLGILITVINVYQNDEILS